MYAIESLELENNYLLDEWQAITEGIMKIPSQKFTKFKLITENLDW